MQMIMLSTVHRFNFNYKRYKADYEPDSEELPKLCQELRHVLFVYENTFATITNYDFQIPVEEGSMPSLLLLAEQLHNLWYQIHHNLLDTELSQLPVMIPHIDRYLKLWSDMVAQGDFAKTSSIRDQVALVDEICALLTD